MRHEIPAGCHCTQCVAQVEGKERGLTKNRANFYGLLLLLLLLFCGLLVLLLLLPPFHLNNVGEANGTWGHMVVLQQKMTFYLEKRDEKHLYSFLVLSIWYSFSHVLPLKSDLWFFTHGNPLLPSFSRMYIFHDLGSDCCRTSGILLLLPPPSAAISFEHSRTTVHREERKRKREIEREKKCVRTQVLFAQSRGSKNKR